MVRGNNIKVLDCTLRDGGFCLEDAKKQNIVTKHFSSKDIQLIIQKLTMAKLDYVEIGAIEESGDNKTIFAIWNEIEEAMLYIEQYKKEYTQYALFFRGPDIPISKIPNCNGESYPIIRLCVRYSELKKSLDYCRLLTQKGYKVSIQPMVTMRYSLPEMEYILGEANNMHAYAVYFVDSYGYMQKEDIVRYFEMYDSKLMADIRVGFHGHNNMNSAYANAKTLLEIETQREIILDSCVMGMGQGAGNLQTELIVPLLDHNRHRYSYDSILDVCDYIDEYNKFNLWGYSVERLLPAIHKVAYKYAFTLRYKYHFKYTEIDRMLASIPEDLRHRYTQENVERLIELAGYSIDRKNGKIINGNNIV